MEQEQAAAVLRAAKRDFLQHAIIDSGFDAALFTDFCEKQRSSDIDRWSLEELQACASAFKAQQLAEEIENSEASTDFHATPQGPEQVHEGEYTVKGREIPPTELCQQGKLEVSVPHAELISGGFFSSPYVLLTVKTTPIGWIVSRRFGDFVDLKKNLALEFPGYFVPPLPSKSRTDPFSLPTFLLHLTRFLQTIVRTPIFLCSPVLKAFLADGRSIFESAIKAARKVKKPDTVDQMWTMSGSIVCRTAPSPPIGLNDYFFHSEVLKRTIAHQFGFVSAALNSLSGQLQLLANSLRSLAELQESVPEAYRQREIYGNLGEVLEEWSRKEAETCNLMELYGQSLFKAEKREARECKLMFKEKEALETAWAKATDHLKDRKERLWTQGDPVKWEIASSYSGDIASLKANKSTAFSYMLARDTQDTQRSKQKLDYLNHQLRTEVLRVLELSATSAAVRLSELGRQWDENKQDLALKWRELLGRLSAFY